MRGWLHAALCIAALLVSLAHFFPLLFILLFVAPLAVVSVCIVLIGLGLW